ncbi:MAG TPA: DUF58 domain-containing protein [Polyangiaceae bacterium]|nr:DUF58 domain-containing protein [Polyangiaceae bacterium]
MAEQHSEPGVFVELDELVELRGEARYSSFLPQQPVRSLLAGRRASRLRGRGLDFDELRSYVPGDDVRSIDWHVTARMRKPYVRTYKEERDRPVLLVVDQRPTMFFGSQSAMKSVAAARLAALAAWRVIAVGDRVGALIVGEHEDLAVRPSRSSGNVFYFCELLAKVGRELATARAAKRANEDSFARALRAASELAPRDTLVMLISDLRGLSDESIALLGSLRKHNDLLLAWIVDPLEAALPDLGLVPVTDGRSTLSVPTADAGFRARFAQKFEEDVRRVREFCAGSGAPYFELRTDRDLLEQVRDTFGESRLPVGRAR